jgi:hypothetical protein
MSNDYYQDSGSPSTGAQGSSATMRAEFAAIEAGFDKLPTLTGNSLKIVGVNVGETALTAVATTGTGSVVLATSPTLTTPTINTAAQVGGTWVAAATWTLPAHTLGGTVTLNGQTLSGNATFSGTIGLTSPAITTSITTPSTTFNLVNTNATTVNFAGAAAVALNIGHASGTNTVLGATAFSQALTVNNTVTVKNVGGATQLYVGDTTDANSFSRLTMAAGLNNKAWRIGVQDLVGAAMTWTPSTTNGGNTFTTPVMTLTDAGALSVLSDFAINTNKFTVTASSGNTLVAGTLNVTGAVTLTTYLAGVEETEPAAPAANGYRIFAVDSGGGKTVLKVRFSSGVSQTIATEP